MDMLSQVGNPLVLIQLENLMKQYATPFYAIGHLNSDLCTMEIDSMTLAQEKATTVLQVSASIGMCPPDPSQMFRPTIGKVTRLTPLTAEFT